MNAPKYYNQIITNVEAGINPKSRQTVLREYFRLYLPSFTTLAPGVAEGFIMGQVSYEQMLLVFREGIAFQESRRQKRIEIFGTLEEQKYGPRSMAPLPRTLVRNPFEIELNRFVEAFGPKGIEGTDVSRVPGTREVIRNRFANLGAW